MPFSLFEFSTALFLRGQMNDVNFVRLTTLYSSTTLVMTTSCGIRVKENRVFVILHLNAYKAFKIRSMKKLIKSYITPLAVNALTPNCLRMSCLSCKPTLKK